MKIIVRIINSGINKLCEEARNKAEEIICRIEKLEKSSDIENIWDNYPIICNLLDELIYEEIESFGNIIQPREKYKYLNKLAICRSVIINIHERKVKELDDKFS